MPPSNHFLCLTVSPMHGALVLDAACLQLVPLIIRSLSSPVVLMNGSTIVYQTAMKGSMRSGHLLDCIGSEVSRIFRSKVLAPTGAHYHSIKAPLPKAFKAWRPETTAIATTAFAYSMTGERFEFPGMEFAADVAQGQFVKKWRDISEDSVARRKVQPHPVVTRKGGLHGVVDGLNEIRSRAPRGHKIVYSRDP